MAVRDRRLRFDALLGVAALAGFATFLALPRLALGGAYVDMRMLAPAIALAFVAIRVKPGHALFERRLALAAAVFLALRTLTATVAMILFAQPQEAALEAVPHIPRGSAVLVLVNQPCTTEWADRRLGHIAGIALARRDIFENGQWTISGQQLLGHRHPATEPYASDPAQLVYPDSCDFKRTRLPVAIRDFDRGTFNYVWTLDFPAQPQLAPDVRRVWSNGVSTLYAVDRDPSRLPVSAATQ